MKQNLLISFSGGRTSAFMTKWLLENMADRFDMIVVFANTGKEREETLQFVKDCDDYFGFNTVWIESITNPEHRKGVVSHVVNFGSANRNGGPFESMIKKHGLPNMNSPHCTRELKSRPISHYAKSIGWQSYSTAIGIRVDEIDRMSINRKENKFIYPLISFIPTTKSDINLFWSKQKFDLRLKGYEGNCDLCWKKSFTKLETIVREHPEKVEWWRKMEEKYGGFVPITKRQEITLPLRMYRLNASIEDIRKRSLNGRVSAIDDSKKFDQYKEQFLFDTLEDYGCSESCEPF